MFVELVNENGVVDCIENTKYVKWQEKNKMFVIAQEEEAEGIVGRDDMKIYQISGTDSRGEFTGEAVELKDVDEETYKSDLEKLTASEEERS